MEDTIKKYICYKDYIIHGSIVAIKGGIYLFESSILYSESLELFYKIQHTKYAIPEWKFILHFERLDESRRRKIKLLLGEDL